MKNKNVLKLVILILILLIITGWQFKPKQKKMSKKENEGIFEEKEMIGGIDLRKIEENFKSIQNKIMQMENKDKIELKYEKSKPLKNPLKSWLIKKESEKTVIPEIQEEKPISIIKSEPKKPDFKISGIVYDKKISYVIINDEVKSEGEKVSDFVIQKIYPEKIIVSDNEGNFFTLNFDFEKGERK